MPQATETSKFLELLSNMMFFALFIHELYKDIWNYKSAIQIKKKEENFLRLSREKRDILVLNGI